MNNNFEQDSFVDQYAYDAVNEWITRIVSITREKEREKREREDIWRHS